MTSLIVPSTMSAGSVQLNPAVTLALAQASVAAYNDFAGLPYTPPTDYKYFARFTGWDPYSGEPERFGLIFRYNGPATVENRYIVAFRGTDSISDVLDDTLWNQMDFKPYRNSVSPTPDVHRGFYEIYSKPIPVAPHIETPSMRDQIFFLLPNPAEVLITGHSLGAALSQLYTLDMRVSMPNVNIANLNFASPRVGGKNWQAACDGVGATQRITRVINYWDYVPDNPPEYIPPIPPWPAWTYVSIGAQFETAFSGPDWSVPIDELPRHSLLNLQTVLTNCVYIEPNQIWKGSFLDAVWQLYDMNSTAPPSGSKAALLAKRKELQDLEASIRASIS
jgi:hypothetical protein